MTLIRLKSLLRLLPDPVGTDGACYIPVCTYSKDDIRTPAKKKDSQRDLRQMSSELDRYPKNYSPIKEVR